MSAALVVPDSADIARTLPSDALYRLEAAGQIATEILDERVIAWTEEGKTQAWIAGELGCKQPAVSKRQTRLGVTARSSRGRPRGSNNSGGIIPDPESQDHADAGAVDAEVVEPDEVLPPDPDPPVGRLPDFVADDADTNPRTVALRWFMWGRDLKQLLEDGVDVETESRDDKRAIKEQADLMVRIARALKGAL